MSLQRKKPTMESGAVKKTGKLNSQSNYSKFELLSTNLEHQRQRLLDALRLGPVTTLLAREVLAICHPAGRVKDLKDRGYHIRRTMVNDIDAAGVEHRVAEYCLCSEKGAKQWA